jgi:hypothetical protein
VNESQLQARWRDLKTRAAATDVLSWNNPTKAANRLIERQEALELLTVWSAFSQGDQQESNELLTMVYELGAICTRDSTGHSWKRDFPDNSTATLFYQALRKLVRFLRMKAELAKSPSPDAN